jgi:hypothetical protein
MKTRKGALLVITGVFFALYVVFFMGVAKAAILDFGIVAPTGGTISYNGAGGPLVGTNITVDNVTGLGGTPLNNNVTIPITNGVLNFTSGNLTGSNPTQWLFGGNPNSPSITLFGGIDFNQDGDRNDPGDIPDNSRIFTGRILDLRVDRGATNLIMVDSFIDVKNPLLVEFYGMPDGLPFEDMIPYIGAFNLSFLPSPSNVQPPDGFTSNPVLSGDITNTPVPEPATMLLLGSGLVGIGVYARRRFSKR